MLPCFWIFSPVREGGPGRNCAVSILQQPAPQGLYLAGPACYTARPARGRRVQSAAPTLLQQPWKLHTVLGYAPRGARNLPLPCPSACVCLRSRV